MSEKFFRNNKDILNVRNIVIATLIGIRLSSVDSQLYFNGEVFNLSYGDYLVKIISSKGFNIMSVMVFLGLLYYSVLYKDTKEYELIRYETLDKYYKKVLVKSIIFTGMYVGIIIINIALSLWIKGTGSFEFSSIVEQLHNSEISSMVVFMNKDLFKYNPVTISIVYFIVLTLFLILMANLLGVINSILQNKILVAGVAVIIFTTIMYDGNFGNGSTVTSYLFFNHIEISYNGFGISLNKYMNMLHSIIYLSSFNTIVYCIGTKILKTKEIFSYKYKFGELK